MERVVITVLATVVLTIIAGVVVTAVVVPVPTSGVEKALLPTVEKALQDARTCLSHPLERLIVRGYRVTHVKIIEPPASAEAATARPAGLAPRQDPFVHSRRHYVDLTAYTLFAIPMFALTLHGGETVEIGSCTKRFIAFEALTG